jgi:uncharacterized membrane protein required for colicin V production
MKLLAAVFAGITLLAALLGFGMNVLPILSLLGKWGAAIALSGFALTSIAHWLEELIPQLEFETGDVHTPSPA